MLQHLSALEAGLLDAERQVAGMRLLMQQRMQPEKENLFQLDKLWGQAATAAEAATAAAAAAMSEQQGVVQRLNQLLPWPTDDHDGYRYI
jgi:hypothetical protein